MSGGNADSTTLESRTPPALALPEAKTVKNRVHLDLRVGTDAVDAVVKGLVAKGATLSHHGRQGPHTWVTVADPEGNELCVSR
jgi:hypothetical protein